MFLLWQKIQEKDGLWASSDDSHRRETLSMYHLPEKLPSRASPTTTHFHSSYDWPFRALNWSEKKMDKKTVIFLCFKVIYSLLSVSMPCLVKKINFTRVFFVYFMHSFKECSKWFTITLQLVQISQLPSRCSLNHIAHSLSVGTSNR